MVFFGDLDHFYKAFASVYHRRLLYVGQLPCARQTTLVLSEMLTLLVIFTGESIWTKKRTISNSSRESLGH